MNGATDKRLSERVPLHGATVDFTDGVKTFSQCTVLNISRKGVAINDISMDAFKKACSSGSRKFTAIVSVQGKHVKIVLSPKWYTNSKALYTKAGFEISKGLSEWLSFVGDVLPTSLSTPKSDVDVWGNDGLKYFRA